MNQVLVIGAKGQLGLCIELLSRDEKLLSFVFLDRKALDITNEKQIRTIFEDNKFDYCINCSAYTGVDKAEEEKELAYQINTLGVAILAKTCKYNDVVLIHISTDFVFDGNSTRPYLEEDVTNPLGVYGKTKLEGEKEIIRNLDRYYIIRTSWLYSCFGNNFLKTILKLSKEKKELSVVNDQIGTPTNAHDLATLILKIIKLKDTKYGIYHFSNLGDTTWFEFAKEIFKQTKTKIDVNPVNSIEFITKAIRPKYSVLDKTKVITTFNISIMDWRESLKTITSIIQRDI